jgi:N,N'-diacetyllegionaminate synthase
MNERVIIIAEAGVNHNGDMALAKKLIDAASDAGADFVKFQTFKAEKIASKQAEKAEYQKKTTGAEESQVAMLKKLELSDKDHEELIAYCRQRSIAFLSTPFDLDSIDLLKGLGISLGKIPSGEITNLPYLQKMAKSFDTLVMSTGMANMEEIEAAIRVILATGFSKNKLTVLHCTTEYPTPFEEVNLKAMQTIRDRFDVSVGYSDHTPGIEVPVAAVALGARLIEKHFTLDRNMEGPDHKASLEPAELKAMITAIRHIELALGSTEKKPSLSEIKNKTVARKSIVAARNLEPGHIIEADDLTAKRPGTGISPMEIPQIIGKKIVQPIGEDQLLTYGHIS